jgi:hypothetical protein
MDFLIGILLIMIVILFLFNFTTISISDNKYSSGTCSSPNYLISNMQNNMYQGIPQPQIASTLNNPLNLSSASTSVSDNYNYNYSKYFFVS